MTKPSKKSFLEQWKSLTESCRTQIIDEKGVQNVLCKGMEDFPYQVKDKDGKIVETKTVKKMIFTDREFNYSLITSSKELVKQFEFLKTFKAYLDIEKVGKGKKKFWVFTPTGEFLDE